MDTLKKILYACLVAITFVIISKLSIKTLYKDNYEKMTETTLLTYEYLIGIAGVMIGYYIFGSKLLGNKIIKIGLIIGGIILIFLSFGLNWDKLSDETKLMTISAIMLFVIYKSYMLFN